MVLVVSMFVARQWIAYTWRRLRCPSIPEDLQDEEPQATRLLRPLGCLRFSLMAASDVVVAPRVPTAVVGPTHPRERRSPLDAPNGPTRTPSPARRRRVVTLA
jgi:hypothetical protein